MPHHVTLVVNFVKIATMFANLDFLEKKSLVDYVFGIGPYSCQEIRMIICSFNLSKFMKSCRANLPLYRVSPKRYTTSDMYDGPVLSGTFL